MHCARKGLDCLQLLQLAAFHLRSFPNFISSGSDRCAHRLCRIQDHSDRTSSSALLLLTGEAALPAGVIDLNLLPDLHAPTCNAGETSRNSPDTSSDGKRSKLQSLGTDCSYPLAGVSARLLGDSWRAQSEWRLHAQRNTWTFV